MHQTGRKVHIMLDQLILVQLFGSPGRDEHALADQAKVTRTLRQAYRFYNMEVVAINRDDLQTEVRHHETVKHAEEFVLVDVQLIGVTIYFFREPKVRLPLNHSFEGRQTDLS